MSISVHIIIRNDSLLVAGDVALVEVLPIVRDWLEVLDRAPSSVALARITRSLDALLVLVRAVQAQGSAIMATVSELSGELDQIKSAVDEVKATVAAQIAEIQALKDQIAAGTPVSQAQLDELDAKADSILASLGVVPPVEG